MHAHDLDKSYGPGTHTAYNKVIAKYPNNPIVWIVTFEDKDSPFEQSVYVVNNDKAFALSYARPLIEFDNKRLKMLYKTTLNSLDPSEVAMFVDTQGNINNAAIFEPENTD